MEKINWRRELDLFFTALMFLTRLPAPSWVSFEKSYLNESSRYFPLVGLLVGLIAATSYILLSLWLGSLLGIILSMAITVFVTGAFHEDGFADMCDGFGGGWEKEQILTIMKDSRLGTYGALGLFLIMATKFVALVSLVMTESSAVLFLDDNFFSRDSYSSTVVIALIVAHPLSRFFAVSFIYRLEYVQDIKQRKVKSVANHMSENSLIFSGVSVVGVLFLVNVVTALVLMVGLFLLHLGFGRYLLSKIGGYTGDCLGAAQQLAEVMIYIVICATFAF